jgi:outer membrane lipase/esterase
MRCFRPSVAAAAIAIMFGSGAASAQFSNAYVFGDSLSDAGQYGARFTTNPGLTFPMYLAQRYGITVSPSFTGGTDFGQGGARVNAQSPLIPSNAPNLSIADQVSTFLGRGAVDPNALYQIQGGANDVFVLSGQLAAGQITQAQLQGAVVQAAGDLVTQVARLQAAGARYIVVYTLPDIGLTPSAAAQNAQGSLTAVSNLFNSTLDAGIGAAHLQVVQVNFSSLLREIVASPAAFGFSNVATPVCTTASALQCTPGTLRDPAGNLTYLFADGVHPTTGLALVGAQAAASMIEAPARIGALAEAPLGVEQAAFRSIDARMQSSAFAPARGNEKFDPWVSYDYSNRDVTGPFVSGDSDANTVAVGGDVKLSDRLLVGIAFNYTEDKSSYGGSGGDFKLKETAATAYVGYGQGPWWVGATLGAGNLDYDVRRSFELGALTRTETGRTTGSHIMASVLGGWWFSAGGLQHGPYARLAWQDVRVHGFSEQGSDSTSLSFGEQKRESFITSLGWQATGQLGSVRPFARVTWEFESKDSDRSVSATPNGMNGTYSMPVVKPDDNFLRYVVGVSSDFGRVTGFITGSGTSGRGDGNGYAVTVGVRVPI